MFRARTVAPGARGDRGTPPPKPSSGAVECSVSACRAASGVSERRRGGRNIERDLDNREVIYNDNEDRPTD